MTFSRTTTAILAFASMTGATPAALANAPAPTSTSPSAPAAAPSGAPAPAPERKVCRSEQRTGSNMVRRVCRTKAEWDAMAEQSAAGSARSLDRRYGSGPDGSGL